MEGNASVPESEESHVPKENSDSKTKRKRNLVSLCEDLQDDSVIIIPDTPSPVFAQKCFKRKPEIDLESTLSNGKTLSPEKKRKQLFSRSFIKPETMLPNENPVHSTRNLIHSASSELSSPSSKKKRINPYFPPDNCDFKTALSELRKRKLSSEKASSKGEDLKDVAFPDSSSSPSLDEDRLPNCLSMKSHSSKKHRRTNCVGCESAQKYQKVTHHNDSRKHKCLCKIGTVISPIKQKTNHGDKRNHSDCNHNLDKQSHVAPSLAWPSESESDDDSEDLCAASSTSTFPQRDFNSKVHQAHSKKNNNSEFVSPFSRHDKKRLAKHRHKSNGHLSSTHDKSLELQNTEDNTTNPPAQNFLSIPSCVGHEALENSFTRQRISLAQRKKKKSDSNDEQKDAFDPVQHLKQVCEDEDFARKLQEEMDLEYAMTLQNLENRPPAIPCPPSLTMTPDSATIPDSTSHGHFNQFISPPKYHRASPRRTRSHRQPDLEELEAMINAVGSPSEHHRSQHGGYNHRRQHHHHHHHMDHMHQHSSQSFRRNHRTHRQDPYMEFLSTISSSMEQREPASRRRFQTQRRSAGPNDYEELLNLAEILGDVKEKGLPSDQLRRLPTRVYKDSARRKEEDECMICMCEYAEEDILRILPCFHEFHSNCIDKWIKGNASCPICREAIKLS